MQADQAHMDFAGGITAIDTGFGGRSWGGACYLVQHAGKAMLIDSGTKLSVEKVLAAIKAKDVAFEDVTYLVITHAHLDHAGGAGDFVAKFPNVKVIAPTHIVTHLVNPGVLTAAVAKTFGDEKFEKFFGAPLAIPEERILGVLDNHTLDFLGREFKLLETPGHTRNHMCVLDEHSGHVFCGDALGYSYPSVNRPERAFVWPATPPADFDYESSLTSIKKLAALSPQAVFLGHGGCITNVPELFADLERLLAKLAEFGKKLPRLKLPPQLRTQRLIALVSKDWSSVGCSSFEFQLRPLLEWDAGMNWQGLESWAERHKPTQASI